MAKQPNPLNLRPLAPYEDRLLSALAFFRTQRNPNNQAHHCLSMYLRQSESRILSEVAFYAQTIGKDKFEFLELIYDRPEEAQKLIEKITGVKVDEVFEVDNHTETQL